MDRLNLADSCRVVRMLLLLDLSAIAKSEVISTIPRNEFTSFFELSFLSSRIIN